MDVCLYHLGAASWVQTAIQFTDGRNHSKEFKRPILTVGCFFLSIRFFKELVGEMLVTWSSAEAFFRRDAANLGVYLRKLQRTKIVDLLVFYVEPVSHNNGIFWSHFFLQNVIYVDWVFIMRTTQWAMYVYIYLYIPYWCVCFIFLYKVQIYSFVTL